MSSYTRQELEISARVLRRGADLLSTPDTWTQGYAGRNAAGEACRSDFADAVSYCALGALEYAWAQERHQLLATGSYGMTPAPLAAALRSFTEALPPDFGKDSGIVAFNDDAKTDHQDVLAAFGRAIAKAEERFA